MNGSLECSLESLAAEIQKIPLGEKKREQLLDVLINRTVVLLINYLRKSGYTHQLGGAEDVEDIAWEAVTKVAEKINTYKVSKAKFAKWAMVIAGNTASDAIKRAKAKRRPQSDYLEELIAVEDYPDDTDSVEGIVITRDEYESAREAIDKVLADLPPIYRDVFELTLEGLEPAEIAAYLGTLNRKQVSYMLGCIYKMTRVLISKK